jgi:hypothetical protein
MLLLAAFRRVGVGSQGEDASHAGDEPWNGAPTIQAGRQHGGEGIETVRRHERTLQWQKP